MKTLRFALLALLLAIGLAGATHAQVSADIHIGPSGQASVDVGYFYDNLASYGNWIERPSYGWVWTPRAVAARWQPYQSGHWVSTDQGWTWVTAEPYGWATYHYGRWYDDPEIGWSWVPGNEWAPSWVSFQEGSDYIGWAPLPPSVNIAVGFNGLVDVAIAPAAYVFVQERYFLAPSLGSYYVPRDRVDVIYRGTRNFSNYRYSGDRVYCNGVTVDQIQRVVGRPVPQYKLADSRTRGAARVQGNQVQVFRPQVQRAANVQPPSARPIARKAVVNAAQFQQSHPDRAARRAVAQGTAQAVAPTGQAAAQPKSAKSARTSQAQSARGQVQPESTPPVRQRKTAPQPSPQQPPAPQPKHQRQPPPPPEQQGPPAAHERHQRPPQDTPPPPQHQAKQQPPPRQQQQDRQPPPPQQEQKQQKQQQRQQEKDKQQQDDHKPPTR